MRFISIVAIIALGISFFVGMKSASPDMRDTANDYFSENNLMDLQINSTIGFTKKEVKKISAVDGVKAAEGVKYADTLVFSGENGIVNASNGAAMACRVMSMDFEKAKKFTETGEADEKYFNRVTLVDGRYPEKKNECLVDYKASEAYNELKLNSVITVSGDGTTLDDTFNTVDFKIVGIVSSPMYVSFERGITNIASGTLGMYLYVSDECFKNSNFTSVYVTVEKNGYDAYSDEYASKLDEVWAKIEAISHDSISDRISDVKKDYTQRIKDGEKAYKELEEKTNQKLENALKNIDATQNFIDNGDSTIAAEKEKLKKKVAEAEKQLKSTKEVYDHNKALYDRDVENARDQDNQYAGSEKAKEIYNSYLKKYKNDIKEINSLKKKVDAAEIKYYQKQNALNEADSSYRTAYNSLAAKENDLRVAQSDLDRLKKQLSDFAEHNPTQIASIEADIRSASAKCNRISGEITELKTKCEQGEKALAKARNEFSTASSEYETLVMNIQNREAECNQDRQVLDEYSEDIKRIKEGEAALSAFEDQLSYAQKILLASKIAITESQLKLYYEESTGNQRIDDLSSELKSAKTRLENAERQYSSVEHDVKIQLSNAQGDIDKNKIFLDELNNSAWTVIRQTELPGQESYGQSLENIDAIANVFPVIFFVIAAFMCLATMTRMVQEERMQLGTLKALGYSNMGVLMKYYCYAAIACLTGSVLGAAAGTLIFPKAVDSAYGMMFNLPSVKIRPNFDYILWGALFYLAVTLISTSIACNNELKVNAAHLMRPKAPVAGKRLFLERFETIWETLSFGSIVTIRNMFRSKKRMVMTITGVACCTTLILSAFGLSNSVDKIISAQYGDGGISEYDLTVTLDEAQTPNESETLKEIQNDIRVKHAMLLETKTMTAVSQSSEGGHKLSVHIVTPEKPQDISHYISLRERKTGKVITLADNGAVISEKLSKDTGVKAGGEINLTTVSGREYKIPVAAVTENYLEHYLYISPTLYSDIFGTKPEYVNVVLSLENYTRGGDEQNLADDLLAMSVVKGVSSTDIMVETFNGVIDRLDVVIVIFITSAGLLALIILYNLTNISVQERLREIATIKVLGFEDGEVTSYVYRENIFMTIVGILIGLAGGTVLHKVVIDIAEVNIAMFGREIYWWSYLLAALITAAFTAAVCVLVHQRLRKLDTIAALKSVE